MIEVIPGIRIFVTFNMSCPFRSEFFAYTLQIESLKNLFLDLTFDNLSRMDLVVHPYMLPHLRGAPTLLSI
jgi:hypothetical protein